MSDELRMTNHFRGWCADESLHTAHPFQVPHANLQTGEETTIDFWCGGEPPAAHEDGQLVIVLVDDACWCQNEEQLGRRMRAAIAHVLGQVRERVEELSEVDSYTDRWGTDHSREVVSVAQLHIALENMQNEPVTEDEDDDE
jgi:hypothetical protein